MPISRREYYKNMHHILVELEAQKEYQSLIRGDIFSLSKRIGNIKNRKELDKSVGAYT
jgi:hypothetical protein